MVKGEAAGASHTDRSGRIRARGCSPRVARAPIVRSGPKLLYRKEVPGIAKKSWAGPDTPAEPQRSVSARGSSASGGRPCSASRTKPAIPCAGRIARPLPSTPVAARHPRGKRMSHRPRGSGDPRVGVLVGHHTLSAPRGWAPRKAWGRCGEAQRAYTMPSRRQGRSREGATVRLAPRSPADPGGPGRHGAVGRRGHADGWRPLWQAPHNATRALRGSRGRATRA